MTVKRLFKFCLVVLPLLTLLVATNVVVDPGNVFRDDISVEMAESLLAGHDTYITTDNLDERSMKNTILREMQQPYDCVAFGNSLIMSVSADMVGTDSYQNFSMSASGIHEYFGMFYTLAERNMLPKRVILCADSMMFDNAHCYSDINALPEDDLYRAACELFSTGKLSEKKLYLLHSGNTNLKDKAEALFSPSYFQESVDQLRKKGFQHVSIGIVDPTYKGTYWRTDGSHVYPEAYTTPSIEAVDACLEVYIQQDCMGQISPNSEMNQTSIWVFESFCNYCKNNGIKVDLFLCPYPPVLWDELETNPKWTLPRQVHSYFYEYARANGLGIIGSYNPYEVGCTTADFLDYRHMKETSMRQFFDFRDIT